MDTEWDNSYNKCVKCGRCVTVCKSTGYKFLSGGRDVGPLVPECCFSAPCHHCTDYFSKPAPCQEVCFYDAISITRS